MISPGEAFAIFEKWKAEGVLLYLFSAHDESKGRFQVAVSEVLSNSARLNLVARKPDAGVEPLSINLTGACFEYSDPRETPDPEVAAQGWVCFVTAFLPAGPTYLFAECVVGDNQA
jgi:hypothetical protein